MKFRILGPLEVADHDGPIALPGPSVAALLAMLLLEPGRVLTIARLSRGMWSDAPPSTAKRQVQNNMARLRRLVGGNRVVPMGEGYLFTSEDSLLDAVRFRELVARSRAQAAAGEPEAAKLSLESGLELWRGQPLAGMSGRIVDIGAKQLEDQRSAAVEELTELQLATGHPDAAVPRLRQLLLEYPHRERAAAQLMLALHRMNLTAEALSVYTDVRARLAEDLGLDPGELLRQRHREILRGYPEPVEPPPTAPVVVAAPKPAQLPAAPAVFIGRDEAVAALTKQVLDTDAIRSCLVTGPAGTGKTALALHWAQRVRDRFPDGQLYINLRGFDAEPPVCETEALSRFVRALQPPGGPVPTGRDELAAQYRSLVDGRRLLIMLDNAATAEQVRPLLAAAEGCFTVVTSRNRMAGLSALNGVPSVLLPPLDIETSAALLFRVTGDDKLRADPGLARRIGELCGGLPLALRISAALLSVGLLPDPEQLARRLSGVDRLSVLRIPDDPAAAVDTALEQSFTAIDPTARASLCALALVPGEDIGRSLALELAGAQTLERLETLNLVERYRPERCRLHDLTRQFARRRAAETTPPIGPDGIADKVVTWYARHRDTLAGEDFRNVVAAVEVWREHPRFWQLLCTSSVFLRTGHDVSLLAADLDTELARALRTGDSEALPQLYAAKANLCFHVGDLSGDLRYARLAVSAGPDRTGALHRSLGTALTGNGEFAEAETTLLRAIEVSREGGHQQVHLLSVCNLANLLRRTGRPAEAAAVLHEARSTIAAAPTDEVEVNLLLTLANVYNAMRRPTDAAAVLAPILATVEELAPGTQAWALTFHADACRELGRYEEAETAILDALRRGSRCYRSHVISMRLSLVEILCDAAQFRRAADRLGEVDLATASAAQRAAHELLSARTRNGLSDHAGAMTAATAAVAGFAGVQPLSHAQALLALAEACDGTGATATARKHREAALPMLDEHDPAEAATVRRFLDEDD